MWYRAGAALPFLLQRLVQDILLVLQHPMEVPHLLPVLSCPAGKVLFLLCQVVTDVTQLQCHLLLVALWGEEAGEWGDVCGPGRRPPGCISYSPSRAVGAHELSELWIGLIWEGKSGSIKPTETGSGLAVASDSGHGVGLPNGYRASIWGDENVLELESSGGCTTSWM